MIWPFKHRHRWDWDGREPGYARRRMQFMAYEEFSYRLCRCGAFVVEYNGCEITGKVPEEHSGRYEQVRWLKQNFHPKHGLTLRSVHPNTVTVETEANK